MGIEQRPLGKTGKTISAIGLGTGTFGREINEDEALPIMDYAFEHGIDFWDTAEAYNSSELIIGSWLKSRGMRDRLTICTKVSKSGKPEYVKDAVQRSLERLGVEKLDIYKLHSRFTDAPIDETLGALNDEVAAGRIGIIGCSNFNTEHLRNALAVSDRNGYARFQILQPPYALADSSRNNYVPRSESETELFPMCVREGVAITTYSPLAAGFMTGKYLNARERSQFPKGARFDIAPAHADAYFSDTNFRRVEMLKAKSEESGIPMVRLAMAWAMTNPHITATLAGARKTDHIQNAIDAYEMRLSPELRAEMSGWQ